MSCMSYWPTDCQRPGLQRATDSAGTGVRRDGRGAWTGLAGRVGRARRVTDGLCSLGRPSRNAATATFRLVRRQPAQPVGHPSRPSHPSRQVSPAGPSVPAAARPRGFPNPRLPATRLTDTQTAFRKISIRYYNYCDLLAATALKTELFKRTYKTFS